MHLLGALLLSHEKQRPSVFCTCCLLLMLRGHSKGVAGPGLALVGALNKRPPTRPACDPWSPLDGGGRGSSVVTQIGTQGRETPSVPHTRAWGSDWLKSKQVQELDGHF